MAEILLQTTIPPTPDDWGIARFGLLRAHLEALDHRVTARDRATPGGTSDPVLAGLDGGGFDQLWLFAVDAGDGLNAEECAAIGRFRDRGGGLMVTRDHMDLGSSVCTLGGVGHAHHFHTQNLNPDPAAQAVDDLGTPSILWPNFHSGANGDYQQIAPAGDVHPVLADPAAAGGVLTYLPAHPHEGDVSAPADDPTARVVATGKSRTTGRDFAIAVAFEPRPGGPGPGWAQSTFHHFADYNWDPSLGAPSFVTEPPGSGLAENPEAMRQTRKFVENLAAWLGR